MLVGEPAKAKNAIVTLPHKKTIEMEDIAGAKVSIPYSVSSPGTFICRAEIRQTIRPGEFVHIPLPESFHGVSHVAVSQRKGSSVDWFENDVYSVVDNSVNLMNSSDRIVTVKKSDHLADVRICNSLKTKGGVSVQRLAAAFNISVETIEQKRRDNIRRVWDVNRRDSEQYDKYEKVYHEEDKNYREKMSVDPDDQLDEKTKRGFEDALKSYNHLFRPEPGKYSGAFGYCSNDINFQTIPPSNKKVPIPSYNEKLTDILANKMDELHNMGVLSTPEECGITPEFTSPSMLVPKGVDSPGEWRLVTAFTGLNKFIKKLPTANPTVEQVKADLAQATKFVALDFSNFYYQSTMKKEDSAYLATLHPYKGLMVYLREPQGLLNAGEHSFEKLAKCFGSMIQQKKATRYADGLYILTREKDPVKANKQLLKHFLEALEIADLAGLTFKPSKVCIAPTKIMLFGWQLNGSKWFPCSHKKSPLRHAELPSTVNKLRGWLGGYKQLSACIPGYAEFIGGLEKLVAGKASAERIDWSDENKEIFEDAKKSIDNIQEVVIPRRDDVLHLYTDFCQDKKAIGARLMAHRKNEDDSTTVLLVGHFSQRLSLLHSCWLPCEGEALALKLAIRHFLPMMRESVNTTIAHSDNSSVVQAFKRARLGNHSASSRIA